MNATFKKMYSLISAIVLFALSVVFVVGALLPSFAVNTVRTESETFSECSLTKGLVVDEGKVGIKNVLKLALNFSDIIYITRIANKEDNIRALEEQLKKTTSESSAESLAKQIRERQSELLKFREERTEDEWKELNKKLQDDAFLDALYVEICLFAAIETAADKTNDTYYEDTSSVGTAVSVIGTLIMIFMLIFTAVMAIVAVIALIKVIFAFLAVIRGKQDDINKICPFKTVASYGALVMFFMLVKVFYGSTVTAGTGLVLALIASALLLLLFSANRIILKENGSVKSIVKVGLNAVTCALAIVLLFTVASLPSWTDFKDTSDMLAKEHFLELKADFFDELKEANPDAKLDTLTYQATVKAEEFTTKAMHKGMILLGAGFVVAMVAYTLCVNSIQRLSGEDKKRKDGTKVPYGPMFVSLVLILVFAVFTSTYGVKTEEDREAAYLEKDTVKILFNEYKIEDSEAQITLETIEDMEDDFEDAMEELNEEIAKAEDEDAKASLLFAKSQLLRTRNLVGLVEDDLSTSESGTIVKAIVLAALAFVVELLLKIHSKLLPESLLNKELFAGAAPAAQEEAEPAPVAEEAIEAEATAEAEETEEVSE